MIKMIEKLKNCPNCAGILDEAGRCKYCGSKVYDFLTIDFDPRKDSSVTNAKTYIRVRSGGKIMLMPILYFMGASITMRSDVCYADDFMGNCRPVMPRFPTREVEFSCVCGDMIIMGDEKEIDET